MTVTVRTIALTELSASSTLEVHPELASTNALFHERFVDKHEQFAPFYAIATTSQTAGKGRLDREWIAPPGGTLALSVYAEFPASAAQRAMGWVSLSAGLALREVLASRIDADRIGIKWPNDVQLDGAKVAGILGELLGVVDGGRAFACVIGIGVNTGIPADQLPTEQATSLQLKGVAADPLDLAPELIRAIARRLTALADADGDADASGLRDELLRHCSTIGADVAVTLADGTALRGRAIGVDALGRLEVRDGQGQLHSVPVGDVEHVRPAEADVRSAEGDSRPAEADPRPAEAEDEQ